MYFHYNRTLWAFSFFVVSVITWGMFSVNSVYAAAPSAGGNTTVVNPSGETAISITEDAVQPESANIRLIVTTLTDTDGGTPSKIRIISVSGGTLWDSGGSSITLGTAGTKLSLSSGRVDLRFRPTSNRDTNASFQYTVVDVQDESINSSESTATISITAVNDTPIMQTVSGDTGIGLAATYYISSWDLTGSTYNRVDSTINFSNNFNVPGYNSDNFSVRWTGQVKAPVTGAYTFSTVTDDGIRLWINDNLIIDNWTVHGSTTDTASAVTLTGSTLYSVKMEFYERGGGEVAVLRWSYPGQSTQVIPQASLFPATTRPALTYVNGSASAIVDNGITISDVDNTSMSSGSVLISSGYNAGEDSLLFTNQNGITGSYSAGSLILTGSASTANWQTALRSVRYANSNSSPDTTTRTIKFKVNDGHDDSNFTFRNIGFSSSNTAPVITEGTGTGVTMDEDGLPTDFSLTLHATDAEYQSISWSITSAASHGTASAGSAGDSTSISYSPTTDYNGTDSFVVQASDGAGGTDSITVTVTITAREEISISGIGATSASTTSETISWTTDAAASTKVSYGLTSSYGTITTETNTSPYLTSHSQTISGLTACTTYHFAVISRNASANAATSSDQTFVTSGCPESSTSTSTPTTVQSGGSRRTTPVQIEQAASNFNNQSPESKNQNVVHASAPIEASTHERVSVVNENGTSFVFHDVWSDDWFGSSVKKVFELKIFEGYKMQDGTPLGLYGPKDEITLGQLAKVGGLLRGQQISGKVTGDDWFEAYMIAAKKAQLSVFAKKTDALSHATRGQVIQTTLEALKIPIEKGNLFYSDVPADSAYADSIATATRLGIVSGDDATNTFRPNDPINRAEVAKIVVQAFLLSH